jgi:hypothetical protein
MRHRKSFYNPHYRGRERWDPRTMQQRRALIRMLRNVMGMYHLTHDDYDLRSRIWHAVNDFMPRNNEWAFRHHSRRALVDTLYRSLYRFTVHYVQNNFRPSMALYEDEVSGFVARFFSAGRGAVSYIDYHSDDDEF